MLITLGNILPVLFFYIINGPSDESDETILQDQKFTSKISLEDYYKMKEKQISDGGRGSSSAYKIFKDYLCNF